MTPYLLTLAVACICTVNALAAPLTGISFKTMAGKEVTLKDYPAKSVLIVNVASRCGNTPQYTALEKLAEKYQERGLVVLGFPCNDFGGQEPGTTAEIQQFCTVKYGVTFPILDKIHVKGNEQAPLYTALTGTGAKYSGEVKWNFGKFLVGKDGEVLARFEPKTLPDDPAVISAIENSLK